jgi:GT2 family glycosyltransferase
MPEIAAIVPTYNRVAKTLRFLQHFQEQLQGQTELQCQVIIIDASSPDGTAAQVQQAYPQVTVLSVPNHYFWTAATNAGVRHALASGAEYMFTVNDDAVLPAGHLGAMFNLARQHHLKILGNRINYLSDPNRVWSLGTYNHWGTADVLRVAYGEQLLAAVPESVLEAEVLPVDALPGNGVLIHRAVFEQVGLYQAQFLPHYHADSELVMRAAQAGIPAFIAPGLCLYNDFHKSQKQPQATGWARYPALFLSKKSHLFAPAILYILLKYCPPHQLLSTGLALGRRLSTSNYR